MAVVTALSCALADPEPVHRTGEELARLLTVPLTAEPVPGEQQRTAEEDGEEEEENRHADAVPWLTDPGLHARLRQGTAQLLHLAHTLADEPFLGGAFGILSGEGVHVCETVGLPEHLAPVLEADAAHALARTVGLHTPSLFAPEATSVMRALHALPSSEQQRLVRRALHHLTGLYPPSSTAPPPAPGPAPPAPPAPGGRRH
ncbi:hypothetical protein [Streptomyces sp. YIM 98790]|uniref:hypothetical protein n=1 Tax=Streptomyces sp. YIM 98790 TaxID=2689077 RepID=UPI001FB6581C|nr:hypothetical protein [Streptomyces sp. YIM 98790]